MILYLQYTICDTRSLTDKKDELLNKPNWKNLEPYKDFVCGSGQVIPRTKRGLNNWIGENYICKINRGFYNISKLNLFNKYQIKCTGKHQYCDGRFLHKYEFVFHLKNIEGHRLRKFKSEHYNNSNFYSYKDLNIIIDEVFSNEVKIRNINHTHDSAKIGKSFKNLKLFHINCTTKNKFISSQDLSKIKICIPQIFLQFQYFDCFHKFPRKILKSKTSPLLPIELYGWMESKNNFPYRFWLLKERIKGEKLFNNSCRKIRISCLRIHSEIECIKQVCQALTKEKVQEKSLESDYIQSFLNDSIKNITKSKRAIQNSSGIDNIDLYIKQVFEELEPGTIDLIFSEIERLRFRKNIHDKTINFLINHLEFNGQIHYGKGDIIGRDKNINK